MPNDFSADRKESLEYMGRENRLIFQTYRRLPVVVDYAEGCKIYDLEGNAYLDFLGGIAVNALGHSHPKIVEAVCAQAQKYMHVSNYFYQGPQVELASMLLSESKMSKVFYCNSGAEATEGAMKLARRWGYLRGKKDIIGFSGGFHGRTYGALSIMDKPHYKEGMGPYLNHTKTLPYNDVEALKAGIGSDTAAIFLEFLQGEGGLSEASPEFVKEIEALREEYDFLVVADEVQTGAGRTGKFYAYQNYDFLPDIVIMAKGIGGGLPLGAIIGSGKTSGLWEKGMHGTTYGGNAVTCAAGIIVVKELKSGLMEKVVEKGNYLKTKLDSLQQDFPEKIISVRGRGLLQGLSLSFDPAKLAQALLEQFVIVNIASGNVLRLAPPLIISYEEIDLFAEKLRLCFQEM